MAFDWKAIIKTVAPVLGTALGGPLGGMAVKAIADTLGLPEQTEEAISNALSGGNPEDLLKLKQADQQFAKDMKALDVDLERIAAGDRDSARRRDVESKDHMTAILGVGVTVGFFGVLGFLLVNGKPVSGGDALLVMLGSLGTAWAAVISYFFGSSAGSAKKDATIGKMAG